MSAAPETPLRASPFAGGRVVVYPNRDAWLAARPRALGSTDAPVLAMAKHPWASPWSVWASKLHPDALDDKPTPAMRWGLRHESTIAAALQEENPQYRVLPVPPFTVVYAAGAEHLSCSPDRLVRHAEFETWGEGVLEIKTSRYGDAFDACDGVPEHYRVQVQHQLLVTGLRWGVLAALIGGSDLRVFEIHRDDDYCEWLRERLTSWWQRHVVEGIPPDPDADDLDAVKAVQPEPKAGKVIGLPASFAPLAKRRQEIAAQLKELEREKKQIEAQIAAQLGDADGAVIPGFGSLTFKQVERQGHWVGPCQFRDLRFKPAKERARKE